MLNQISSGFISPARRHASDRISYSALPTNEKFLNVNVRDATGSHEGNNSEQHGPRYRSCVEDYEDSGLFEIFRCGDNRKDLASGVLQGIVILLIIANAIVIGLETDNQNAFNWDLVENLFLCAFTIELGVRMYYYGCGNFFKLRENPELTWNVLDFGIVAAGIFNVFLSLLVDDNIISHGVTDKNDSTLFRIVRVVRLLRVLRIIRIVRFLKQLYLLAYGFVEGTMAVFWVTLLASFVLYVCSIILVRAYGHADTEIDEDAELFHHKFGTIPRTMFALFELVSAPDLNPYRATLFRNPGLVVFLVAFIIVGSFGINGLLVALINESILEKNQARIEAERLERELKRKKLQQKCGELFDSLDIHRNRVLRRSVLQTAGPELAGLLMSLGINFHKKDLDQIFYVMDFEDTGIIDRSEFVQGLVDLSDQVRPMSIMELHYQVTKCASKIETADLKIESVLRGVERQGDMIEGMGRKFEDLLKMKEDRPPQDPGPNSNLPAKCTFEQDNPPEASVPSLLVEHQTMLADATAKANALIANLGSPDHPDSRRKPPAKDEFVSFGDRLLDMERATLKAMSSFLEQVWAGSVRDSVGLVGGPSPSVQGQLEAGSSKQSAVVQPLLSREESASHSLTADSHKGKQEDSHRINSCAAARRNVSFEAAPGIPALPLPVPPSAAPSSAASAGKSASVLLSSSPSLSAYSAFASEYKEIGPPAHERTEAAGTTVPALAPTAAR